MSSDMRSQVAENGDLTATVAEFAELGDMPFSATVTVFGDSVDRA